MKENGYNEMCLLNMMNDSFEEDVNIRSTLRTVGFGVDKRRGFIRSCMFIERIFEDIDLVSILF
jgi:hypothetical protein